MSPDILYVAGAFGSALATVVTFVTGILFFRKAGRWGIANDIASIVQVVLMGPLVVLTFESTGETFPALSLVASVLGGAGIALAAAFQLVLVLRVMSYEQSSMFSTSAGAAIGAWLMLANVLAAASGRTATFQALLGVAAGVGYVALVAGYLAAGRKHWSFQAGSVLALAAYCGWSTWLGVSLMRG